MAEMTSYERIKRMYEHRDADRIPVMDSPWGSTLERWRREGMPKDADFSDYFGLDQIPSIWVDNSPRFPTKVIEETEDYIIDTTAWGATRKNWKHRGSVPETIDFLVKSPDDWKGAKARMTPDRDRVNWDHLAANYPKWKKRGLWISATFWFGYDITHAGFIGTERVLEAMITDPEWMVDVWNHELDVAIALHDRVWEAGYHADELIWYDDMGYKLHQFFSPAMYRRLLRPVHQRACEWARAKGLRIHLHSCGDIRPFVPDYIDIGIEMLNPLEVKAGVDPIALKQQFGDKLAFHGGLNAVLYTTPEAQWAEMTRVIPAMKAHGGYIASTDHSVPDNVSLDQFRQFVELAKKLGKYE